MNKPFPVALPRAGNFGLALFGVALIGMVLASVGSRAEEYPVGDRDSMWADPYLIGSLRRMGEIYLSRPVPRGDTHSELPQGMVVSGLTYTRIDRTYTLEGYLARSRTTGLIVLSKGRIVYESYRLGADAQSTFASQSIAKSVVSTLVGIAIGEGLIASVDDPVSRYLPELNGTGYQDVPIKALLQMSSGIAWIEDYSASISDFNLMWQATAQHNRASVTDFVRTLKRRHEPFAKFQYAAADTIVLGWLLSRATGGTLSDYLSAKLWRPLGMQADASWMVDQPGSNGSEIPFCCLNATLRDYARFGLLMAQDGMWQGSRLLPPGWVAEATRPDRPQVQPGKLYPGYDFGYQYQWRTFPGGDSAFLGQGVNGQFLYVNPARQLVIVMTSAWPDWWNEELERHAYAVFDAFAARLME